MTASDGNIEKILKINLRLFLFNLAGTSEQCRANGDKEGKNAPCIFLSIFNQCSITESAQEALHSHCSLFFVLDSKQLILQCRVSPLCRQIECARGFFVFNLHIEWWLFRTSNSFFAFWKYETLSSGCMAMEVHNPFHYQLGFEKNSILMEFKKFISFVAN